MFARISLLFIVICCLTATVLADTNGTPADCRAGWLCIEQARDGSDALLLAKNIQAFPLTLTVRARVTGGDNRYRTETLAPHSVSELFRFANAGRASSIRYSLGWTVGTQNVNHDDDYLYRLPYESGRSYRILQGFGSRFSHTGLEEFAVDFNMSIGTPVHAARSGVVARTEASNTKGCWEDGCSAYANYIVILHDDGSTGEYLHLNYNGVLVRPGQYVSAGQHIGQSGNTGHSTMPHLHFAVYEAKRWGNTQSLPMRFRSSSGILERPRRGQRPVAN